MESEVDCDAKWEERKAGSDTETGKKQRCDTCNKIVPPEEIEERCCEMGVVK
tara:strand:+ start:354 stop:509 length:156 start_codon:yes stop_codon:yes gene_type:complete